MRLPRLHTHGRMLAAFLALSLGALAFLKFASEVSEGDTMAFDRILLLALRTTDPSVPAGPAGRAGVLAPHNRSTIAAANSDVLTSVAPSMSRAKS